MRILSIDHRHNSPSQGSQRNQTHFIFIIKGDKHLLKQYLVGGMHSLYEDEPHQRNISVGQSFDIYQGYKEMPLAFIY